MIRRICLIAAVALLPAACGDDDDATAPSTTVTPSTTSSPTTTATAATATTTVAPATTAPTTSVSRAATTTEVGAPAGCSASPAFDASGSLRDQFVAFLTSCGFTQSEAACIFDHLDFADPDVVAGETNAMLPAFEACDIDADRMAEIGGGP